MKEEDIGLSVYLKRRDLRLSQSELARLIGVTKSGVSKIERGGGLSNGLRNKLNQVLGLNISMKPIPRSHLYKPLKRQIEDLRKEIIEKDNLLERAFFAGRYSFDGSYEEWKANLILTKQEEKKHG